MSSAKSHRAEQPKENQESPLQLERYFFSDVACVANKSYAAEKATEEERVQDFTVETTFRRHKKDPNRYSIILTIKSDADSRIGCPYSYNLTVEGFFRIVDPSLDETAKSAYLTNAGPSILYGASREFLLQLASRGPHEALPLPMISFPSRGLTFDDDSKDGAEENQGRSTKTSGG